MANLWEVMPLGDICSVTSRLVEPTLPEYRDLPHIGIDKLESASGLLLPLRSAAEDGVTSGKYLFSPDDVIYSKIRPELRKAAFPRIVGLSSADAYPLRTTSRCLPEFLLLLLLSEAFSERAIGRSGRTKMPKINRSELLSIEVSVPPLFVQRRIVDLVAHVDTQVEALRAEAAAGTAMEGPLIEELVVSRVQGVESLPLGEVGEFIRGRRFTKDEYVPTGLGCIHYGQIHTHFGPVAERALTFLPEESRSRLRLARPGDVLIAATSEDVTGLGKATVWLGSDDVAVHDDCYIFRHQLDPRFASYLFASPMFQRQKRQYAGGTKVTRISGVDLAKIEMPIPPIAVQARIGAALNALSDQVDAVQVEVAALRLLRAMILEELLSARIDIPQSYDSLLHCAGQLREVKR